METKNFFATNGKGDVMPDALVYVYRTGTQTIATDLRDISGNPLDNPFNSQANGLIQFQAPNNTYDIRVVKGARDYTLRGIQCADLVTVLAQTAAFLGTATTNPTKRTDGTALQAGDRYFNIADDYEYIYNGTVWSVNNLTGADIADEDDPLKGAHLVGWDGSNVGEALKYNKPFADYAAIRAYSGIAVYGHVDAEGIAGDFRKNIEVANPVDDGGLRIVDAAGFAWDRVFSGPVRPEFWGAKLNSTFDSFTALKAALDSKHAIVLGDGYYTSGGDLFTENRTLDILGIGAQSTEIRFTKQCVYGIRVEQNGAYESNVKNLFVSTTLLNNGIGLSISYAKFQGEFERNKRFVNLYNVRAAGLDYFSQGWRGGIEVDEGTLPMVDKCFVVGYRNLNGDTTNPSTRWWPHTEFGFAYTSSKNLEPTDALFSGCDVRYAQVPYKVSGTVEGLRFKSCLAVACRKGIVDDRRATSGPASINPWVNVDDCHFNVAESAYESEYMYQGWLTDNIIYQFGFVDSDFIGINTDYGNNLKILGNEILGNKDSKKVTKGIRNQQNNESLVAFNNIQFVDTPIECSGTGGIAGVRYFMNKGTNKQGVETQTVTYVNGASPYANPSSNPVGIVSEGSNAAGVNVAANNVATIATFSLDAFPAGAVFRITALCQVMKGGTTGTTKVYIEKTAGDASVAYMANSTSLGTQNDAHTTGVNWQANLVGIIKKTSAGSLSLKMAVASNGSNASIAALDGQYVLERII